MSDTPNENEVIPDEDILFYHIPKGIFAPYFNFDEIPPHAFTPVGEHLSLNCAKYCSTAQACLDIQTTRYPEGRTKHTHGVGHFIAGDIRSIKFLGVHYSPSPNNKAHSHINGIPIPPKKPKELRKPYNEMRKKLSRIFNSWDIRPIQDDVDPK